VPFAISSIFQLMGKSTSLMLSDFNDLASISSPVRFTVILYRLYSFFTDFSPCNLQSVIYTDSGPPIQVESQAVVAKAI
jgi:hypothetical protein